MPMIYKRFTEKSAEEWRQIYKALQLMEFLIKNGSERVIDDARSHLSLLKMLRQFHFIDQNGKDQGINVRNRSKELTELLSDVDKIRTERKKARTTKNKYGGVEGGAGIGIGGGGSSSRYGGFGSESAGQSAGYGGSTRGVYGDGGGFGGETHEDYDEGGRTGGADRFDEYDEDDDGGARAAPARRKAATTSTSQRAAKKVEPPQPKQPEVDLFDFGDEEAVAMPSSASGATIAAPMSLAAPAPVADDDDFDDFQSAAPAPAAPSIAKPNYSSFASPVSTGGTTSATQFAQPAPQSGAQTASFNNLFSATSPPPSSTGTSFSLPMQTQQPKPTGYQPSGPNYFTSVQVQPNQTQPGSMPGSRIMSPTGSIGVQSNAGKKPAAGGDAFASLLGGMKKTESPAAKGMTIADMAKQKSQAGLYGAPAAASMPAPSNGSTKLSAGGSAMDDLLG
nr:enth domain-containing protein [Quercus suber]